MPATYTKRTVRVTLDLKCYEDLDLDSINWREVLDLEGDEEVDVTIKDIPDIFQCAKYQTGTVPLEGCLNLGYIDFVEQQSTMVLFTATNYGCVFTLSQEDGDELYYAPIYADGTVNLKEFAPVDLDSADMDEVELFDIRNRLVEMCQI